MEDTSLKCDICQRPYTTKELADLCNVLCNTYTTLAHINKNKYIKRQSTAISNLIKIIDVFKLTHSLKDNPLEISKCWEGVQIKVLNIVPVGSKEWLLWDHFIGYILALSQPTDIEDIYFVSIDKLEESIDTLIQGYEENNPKNHTNPEFQQLELQYPSVV